MLKHNLHAMLVDENNFPMNFLEDEHQYAERIMIYKQDGKIMKVPLLYIEEDASYTWTKYGLEDEENIYGYIEANAKEMLVLLKLVEIDYAVKHRLHKNHANVTQAHKRMNE